MDFKTALQMRLSVMKPRRQDVEQFLLEHPHKITPGMREFRISVRSLIPPS